MQRAQSATDKAPGAVKAFARPARGSLPDIAW
jgi:hypothetical protein